jgi:hypothetical protein
MELSLDEKAELIRAEQIRESEEAYGYEFQGWKYVAGSGWASKEDKDKFARYFNLTYRSNASRVG